jgi:hypothetical protein
LSDNFFTGSVRFRQNYWKLPPFPEAAWLSGIASASGTGDHRFESRQCARFSVHCDNVPCNLPNLHCCGVFQRALHKSRKTNTLHTHVYPGWIRSHDSFALKHETIPLDHAAGARTNL